MNIYPEVRGSVVLIPSALAMAASTTTTEEGVGTHRVAEV